MEYILYFIGFAIGIILFIYALSFYESGKERIKASTVKGDKSPNDEKNKSSGISVSPQNISYQDLKRQPKERICPLCGSVLTKYEALYASKFEKSKGKMVLIYGCRYCYKPDEDPDEEKKAEI